MRQIKGFTLIEISIVIAIIGVIAVLALSIFGSGFTSSAKAQKLSKTALDVYSFIDSYNSECFEIKSLAIDSTGKFTATNKPKNREYLTELISRGVEDSCAKTKINKINNIDFDSTTSIVSYDSYSLLTYTIEPDDIAKGFKSGGLIFKNINPKTVKALVKDLNTTVSKQFVPVGSNYVQLVKNATTESYDVKYYLGWGNLTGTEVIVTSTPAPAPVTPAPAATPTPMAGGSTPAPATPAPATPTPIMVGGSTPAPATPAPESYPASDYLAQFSTMYTQTGGLNIPNEFAGLGQAQCTQYSNGKAYRTSLLQTCTTIGQCLAYTPRSGMSYCSSSITCTNLNPTSPPTCAN